MPGKKRAGSGRKRLMVWALVGIVGMMAVATGMVVSEWSGDEYTWVWRRIQRRVVSRDSWMKWKAPDLEMTERLRLVAELDNLPARLQFVPKYRVSASLPVFGSRPWQRSRLALALLQAGELEESIEVFESILEAVKPGQRGVGAEFRRRMTAYLGIAYLRLGELENCLEQHNPQSCYLPIREAGVHQRQRGSRGAIEVYGKILERSPDDLESRWLINLAHMTIGSYPEGVPEAWLIPPEVFESDNDIGEFEDIASQLGLDTLSGAGGAVMDDFNGDGNLDVVASGWGPREQLRYFENTGDGSFVERTEEVGLTGQFGGLSVVHVDYDNDGFLDLMVQRGGWLKHNGEHPNSLLRNHEGRYFEDVTEKTGLLEFSPTGAVGWADYDNDGLLDLFVGNESARGRVYPSALYRNLGDGSFAADPTLTGLEFKGRVKGVAWGDYDNDGLPDLFLALFGQPNLLFRNEGSVDGSWTFREVGEAMGVVEPRFAFTSWFWDYDNDGWLDLFVSSYQAKLHQVVADVLGEPSEGERPRLYRNLKGADFEDVTESVGLSDVLLIMGANYGDVDNDGFLDLYLGTGGPAFSLLVPNRLYRSAAGRFFEDVTTSAAVGHVQKGHGIAFGDLDNDGDQDIFAQTGGFFTSDGYHNVLFENPGHGNRWLTVRLRGSDSNSFGLGARLRVVFVENGVEREVHHLVSQGGSFGSSSLQQEIGLGSAERIVELSIRWPGGAAPQVLTDVPLDSVIEVTEGEVAWSPVPLVRIDLAGGDAPGSQHNH